MQIRGTSDIHELCKDGLQNQKSETEHHTASPGMNASRVRTPLILRGVFREISLFLPSQRD